MDSYKLPYGALPPPAERNNHYKKGYGTKRGGFSFTRQMPKETAELSKNKNIRESF